MPCFFCHWQRRATRPLPLRLAKSRPCGAVARLHAAAAAVTRLPPPATGGGRLVPPCVKSNFPFGSGVSCSTGQGHRKICKKIGLTHNVTVHGLRHTYVTHYYVKHKNDPDFDLATFSKSIGHSSIRTTMEIYAHLDMTQNRFVQRSMDDLKDFQCLIGVQKAADV